MAVHVTIYPDDRVAAALRRFMAAHDCSATTAVQLLLERELARQGPADEQRAEAHAGIQHGDDLEGIARPEPLMTLLVARTARSSPGNPAAGNAAAVTAPAAEGIGR